MTLSEGMGQSVEADAELAELHDAYQLPALLHRKFTHAELWEVLGPLADEAAVLEREEIGRSAEGRPLYAVRCGEGPLRVLLWSQMHGDEPTHTMGLADLLHYLAREPDDARARRILEALTLVAVPMLNPDGAERFRRFNAQGIDMNTDARAWVTPELRSLRALYERFRPDFAFNLHDQNVRARVGSTRRLAAMALLACPFNEAGEDDDVRLRGKRLAAVIRRAVDPLIGGHVTRYSDAYEPRGMGEHMQRAGTSTVLVEMGGWPNDPEKQFLRKVSFVALLSALESLADGSYARAPLEEYHALETNSRMVVDLLVSGGTMVAPGLEPYRADVGVHFEAPLDLRNGTIAQLGDLADYLGRETLDATGLFLHPGPAALTPGVGERPTLEVGNDADFVLRRGPEGESEPVWILEKGVARPVEREETRRSA